MCLHFYNICNYFHNLGTWFVVRGLWFVTRKYWANLWLMILFFLVFDFHEPQTTYQSFNVPLF